MKRNHEGIKHPRGYQFKLHPTAEQREVMERHFRMVAELWNAMLEMQETRYRHIAGQRGVVHRGDGHLLKGRWRPVEKAHLSFFDLTAAITELRHECPEWAALSVWTPHRVADALVKAFEAFFARARGGAGRSSGYPRYRRTAAANWLPHRFVSGCKLSMLYPDAECTSRRQGRRKHWHLRLKGVDGEIHTMGTFPRFPSKLTDADIRRDPRGVWWLSVSTYMPPRIPDAPGEQREPARHSAFTHPDAPGGSARVPHEPRRIPMVVTFDLVDCLAVVNGHPETPPMLIATSAMQDELDALKSAFDQRWPHGRRLTETERANRDDEWRPIRARSAKIVRQRRVALHAWTRSIVRCANRLVVRVPAVKEVTQSPRGDVRQWGAMVREVSGLNRHVLNQCPAAAVAMFRYKAEEAGIPCEIVKIDDTQAMVGRDLTAAGKAARRARRDIRKEAA